MSSEHYSPTTIDQLQALVSAIQQAPEGDSLGGGLSAAQWALVAPYLQPLELGPSQVLFDQGSTDRSLYLIESGSLSVHYQDAKQRVRLAIVGSGSVVGEGAFFSHRARSATVQSNGVSRLWGLTPLRFGELSNRQPTAALALVMAVGGVLAKRLANRRLRVAAT
ncbi:Crp/Fnr family transcriptional regulator [Comamonas flocculans]|uniref:Cyclic nucleotide-binding domain-containing protein n=1 Tax=Comamonas flocculans TaxID=2597701 RepID=A0A5B8RTL5_9BURK|nr:cyclic nucleotide-binding domain-containing protein [Comamonas flocculans]QEA12979.1 cyclic nucleotide-binding domain-containing protein [Comamonas flocculans]